MFREEEDRIRVMVEGLNRLVHRGIDGIAQRAALRRESVAGGAHLFRHEPDDASAYESVFRRGVETHFSLSSGFALTRES